MRRLSFLGPKLLAAAVIGLAAQSEKVVLQLALCKSCKANSLGSFRRQQLSCLIKERHRKGILEGTSYLKEQRLGLYIWKEDTKAEAEGMAVAGWNTWQKMLCLAVKDNDIEYFLKDLVCPFK